VIKTTSPGCNREGFELDPITTALVEAAPGILRTTAARIFAAGDVTGRSMVVHEAMRQALVAATNATLGAATTLPTEVSPVGSFTDLEVRQRAWPSRNRHRSQAGHLSPAHPIRVMTATFPRSSLAGQAADARSI
jgi:hypothetical protein